MSLYISNFLARVDFPEKKKYHLQIFEEMLIAKNHFLDIKSQVIFDLDPCLSECHKSQLKTIAMAALKEKKFGEALLFFIQLTAFQLKEFTDDLNSNNNH